MFSATSNWRLKRGPVMAKAKATKTVAPNMEQANSDSFQLTPEEMQAILAIRARSLEPTPAPEPTDSKFGVQELAQALVGAIEATRPPEKKTVFTRKKLNPWMPKDGSAKILKFKRPMYHHGIPINPKTTLNENCILLDKVKPGVYCSGYVRVTKRKDGGLDIDYPIRTAAQRLKLGSQFGINSFNQLLQRLVDERADPRRYTPIEELDD